ncbi:MAG: hypothetical protein C4533_02985 [Candidatus Omnitrophota bacterium]|nr:MAG: hypothetical protein C4533_02985 [Candidatus Omnitrophota bacterium]
MRTLAGNFQLFYYLKELFNPFRGKISWQFFSHKFLRLIIPLFLALLLLSSAFLFNEPFYRLFLFSQEAFYIFAILGKYSKRRNKIFDVPYMFCIMNYAAVIGFYRFLNNKQGVLWEKAATLDLRKA